MISHPCARCGATTEGIALGGVCADCQRILMRRAVRIGRWVAFTTTALLAAYLIARLRTVAPGWRQQSQIVTAVAIVSWYWLTYRIVKRVVREWER